DAVIEEIRDADAILALHRVDVAGALRARERRPVRLVNVSLETYATRSWSADHQALPESEIALTADADLAVTALREAVAHRMARSPSARRRAEDRARVLASRSRERRVAWTAANEKRRDSSPIHLARALVELRAALGVRADDAIVAQAPLGPWPTTA